MYILNYSEQHKLDEEQYINLIRDYISKDKRDAFDVDIDMQDKLKRIYNKYLNAKL